MKHKTIKELQKIEQKKRKQKINATLWKPTKDRTKCGNIMDYEQNDQKKDN